VVVGVRGNQQPKEEENVVGRRVKNNVFTAKHQKLGYFSLYYQLSITVTKPEIINF
jgi:hypothetical protein